MRIYYLKKATAIKVITQMLSITLLYLLWCIATKDTERVTFRNILTFFSYTPTTTIFFYYTDNQKG